MLSGWIYIRARFGCVCNIARRAQVEFARFALPVPSARYASSNGLSRYISRAFSASRRYSFIAKNLHSTVRGNAGLEEEVRRGGILGKAEIWNVEKWMGFPLQIGIYECWKVRFQKFIPRALVSFGSVVDWFLYKFLWFNYKKCVEMCLFLLWIICFRLLVWSFRRCSIF